MIFAPVYRNGGFLLKKINANFNKKAPKIVHDVYTQRNESKRMNVDFDTLDRTSKRINRIFYEK